ncbi:MAG: hypothetical protein JWN52_6628 [Actinomycetia bacterium]|nr:hypothetical protein [Actinomycetes bacterium]
MSRVVNGQQEPTVAILRKIGSLFGVPLGEMMVVAGIAERDELAHFGAAHLTAGSSMTVDEDGVTITRSAPNLAEPPADLPGHVLWAGLSIWEKEIWLLKGFSVDERRGMIFYVMASRQDEASQRQVAAPERREQNG